MCWRPWQLKEKWISFTHVLKILWCSYYYKWSSKSIFFCLNETFLVRVCQKQLQCWYLNYFRISIYIYINPIEGTFSRGHIILLILGPNLFIYWKFVYLFILINGNKFPKPYLHLSMYSYYYYLFPCSFSVYISL